MPVDYDHEEEVRGIYRTPGFHRGDAPASYGVGYAGGDSAPPTVNTAPILDLDVGYAGYDRDNYTYEREPDLYEINEQSNPNLKLYEERLVASKTRQKSGDSVISKRVETETANASVDVNKERVVIERMPARDSAAMTGDAAFQEGEVARVEVYEEVPEFRKETFVREEVRVSKVVDQDTATAQETLRREELDIDGSPVENAR